MAGVPALAMLLRVSRPGHRPAPAGGVLGIAGGYADMVSAALGGQPCHSPRSASRALTPRRALRLGRREGTGLCRSRHSGVNAEVFRLTQAWPGSWQPMAKIAGYAIPGIVWFFVWLALIILALILLGLIVHWAGGGVLNLRLGHFVLDVGFT
jgi:hypothetical protein